MPTLVFVKSLFGLSKFNLRWLFRAMLENVLDTHRSAYLIRKQHNHNKMK